MSYIRVVWVKGRPYYQECENYRQDGKVKVRFLRHLGPRGKLSSEYDHRLGSKTLAKIEKYLKKNKLVTTSSDKLVTTETEKDMYKHLMSKEKGKNLFNIASMRKMAEIRKIPSGGIKRPTLARRLAKQLVKEQGKGKGKGFQNIPEGSLTTVSRTEKDENIKIQVIDKDIEPMRGVEVVKMGPGMYDIQQETLDGQKENVTVMVSHNEDPETHYKKQQAKKKKPPVIHDSLDDLKKLRKTAIHEEKEAKKRKDWNQEGKADFYAKSEEMARDWRIEIEAKIEELEKTQ